MTRSKLSIWIQATRAFSFTASMIPVLLGAVLALFNNGKVDWFLLPIIIACSLLFHAATNIVNDYFDHKKGVDKDYTFGSSGILVQGLLKPKQLFIGGLTMFLVGSLLGLYLVYLRGLPMLWLGLIGFIGGYFYTGKPFEFKYLALGDLLVFVLMGPLMVTGSYFALTGNFNINVLLISLPVGFLVDAILHANNLRDISHDQDAKIKTFAMVLKSRGAKIQYILLLSAAYISVAVMILKSILPIWSLAVLLSLPIGIKNIREVTSAKSNQPESIAMIDVKTAQLHMIFGILLIGSLLCNYFIS